SIVCRACPLLLSAGSDPKGRGCRARSTVGTYCPRRRRSHPLRRSPLAYWKDHGLTSARNPYRETGLVPSPRKFPSRAQRMEQGLFLPPSLQNSESLLLHDLNNRRHEESSC